MNKNKILNIIIVILLVACIILGGKIVIENYKLNCEIYNDNIINFTVEMIKGNKTLEDIDMLDVNESVKNSLRQYYNDTFYNESDKIVLYDDINFWMQNKDLIAEIQKEYGDAILEEDCPYFFDNISEDDSDMYSEEDLKFFELSNLYIDILKNNKDNRVFEEDNKICIYVKDLNFDTEGKETIIYKGFKFNIYASSLDKDLVSYHKNSDIYKTIEIKKIIEQEDNYFKVILKNDFDSVISIFYKLKLGKIDEININVRV